MRIELIVKKWVAVDYAVVKVTIEGEANLVELIKAEIAKNQELHIE